MTHLHSSGVHSSQSVLDHTDALAGDAAHAKLVHRTRVVDSDQHLKWVDPGNYIITETPNGNT